MNDGTLRLDAARFIWRDLDGEAVVLDLQESRYLTVNPTGTLLWAQLAEGATRAGLVERLVSACGVAREQADRDVGLFLADLTARGGLLAS